MANLPYILFRSFLDFNEMFKVTKDKIVLLTWIDFTDGFINASWR